MAFTNKNPCRYSYNSSDESFSFDLNFWLQETIPRRKLQSERIFQEQNDKNSKMYNIPVKLSLEELARTRLSYKYYVTDNFNSDGSPIEINFEEIQNRLLRDAGLVAPKALELIKKVHPNGASRFALTYVGEQSDYKAYGHFHPHILNQDGSYNRDCKTCVVIIPIDHTMPATEKVFFNHQEFVSDEEEEIIETCRITASPYDKPRGNIVDIPMPNMGECLVVEFVGSRCLHWLENYGTENKYLCLIAEN
jgi:hypothetical protein